LLLNFGNYIRNPTKILASCQKAKIWWGFFFIKVNRPIERAWLPTYFFAKFATLDFKMTNVKLPIFDKKC
jgi:hypothetical protein